MSAGINSVLSWPFKDKAGIVNLQLVQAVAYTSELIYFLAQSQSGTFVPVFPCLVILSAVVF